MLKDLVSSKLKDREIQHLRDALSDIVEMLDNDNYRGSTATALYCNRRAKEALKESLLRIPKLP